MIEIITYGEVPLETIMGGVRGFSATPSIDGRPLDDYVIVGCEGLEESPYTPVSLAKGDVFCSYILLYPSFSTIWVKVGSADRSSCVARMFQQAPVVAIVSDLVVARKHLSDREELDREIGKKLGKLALKEEGKIRVRTMMSSGDVVKVWKHVVRAGVSIDNVLNLGFKLAIEASRMLKGFGQTLLPKPGYAWFTTLELLGKHDIGILRAHGHVKLKAWICSGKQILKIRHLPNGLFHVLLEGRENLYGRPVSGLLTFNDLKRLKLKIVKE